MLMEHNKSPMSLREGGVFIDGNRVMDAIKAEFKLTPETWQGKQLGERTNSTRWLGYGISVSITRRRSTPWLREAIKEYVTPGGSKYGRTPEFTIQGIMDDKNSDYFADFGKGENVTLYGCVLTGDLPLISLDSGGEVVEDAVSFSAKSITFD